VLNTKNDVIESLFKIGAIQVGEFLLASGITSPIYIDLRRIISFPELYQYMVDLLAHEILEKEWHHVVGVPYAALPLASGIALLYQKSMIMPRKEKKDHGTARSIEGVFEKDDIAIVVEDIVTSGSSVENTLKTLKQAGICVKDVVVFLDRQQVARQKLIDYGVQLHAICTLSDVLSILHNGGYLDTTTIKAINQFLTEHQF
jgi:uridine monophosphate synthetase